MPSNAAKGAYYKARTRRWLLEKGFHVWEMELVRWLFLPGGKRIPQKQDQMGADLGACNGEHLYLIQVKGGEAARTGYFPDAKREFAKYTFPPFVKLRIVAWSPGAREPRVLNGRS